MADKQKDALNQIATSTDLAWLHHQRAYYASIQAEIEGKLAAAANQLSDLPGASEELASLEPAAMSGVRLATEAIDKRINELAKD